MDRVNSIPQSGTSFFVAGGFGNSIKLGPLPAGDYYMQVTLEFYDPYPGMPVPSRISTSLPSFITVARVI